jgi:uncharacterized RDD family membrane protein YckC
MKALYASSQDWASLPVQFIVLLYPLGAVQAVLACPKSVLACFICHRFESIQPKCRNFAAFPPRLCRIHDFLAGLKTVNEISPE